MSYKLALDFLKNQGKSDNIINLDLLEELLLKDKFGKYQSVKQKVQHTFDFPEDKDMSLARFCEQIFFARRRNFGKAWIAKK